MAAAASAGAAAAKPLPVTTGWKPVDSFDGDHDLGDSAESAIDPERFTPLTEEELDAQLDIIERRKRKRMMTKVNWVTPTVMISITKQWKRSCAG